MLMVEAQAKYVGHLGGEISKNLFLKGKKHKFYVVSTLMGTTVDLKVLSQQLGLGNAGLRMASEEALQEILQEKVKLSSNPISHKVQRHRHLNPQHSGADVRKFIDEIIGKTSSLVLSQITSETIQQHGEHLGNVVSDGVRNRKHLSTDLERITALFKNPAYTKGFHSGGQTGYIRKCPS